jgi:DNA-directed RNA polymerase subunit RPC12/RpoP
MNLGRKLALLCLDCGEIHQDRQGRCPHCGSRKCVDPRRSVESLWSHGVIVDGVPAGARAEDGRVG